MKFKVNENLPGESVDDLHIAGHDAETVFSERLTGIDDDTLIEHAKLEQRVLLTLDRGIANLRTYPPGSHCGIVSFRAGSGRPLSHHRGCTPDLPIF